MNRPRFHFEFHGSASVGVAGFFGANRDEDVSDIALNDIQAVLDDYQDIGAFLEEWSLMSCIEATLVDTETGARWEFDGWDWKMVQDRRLLPGEQRLFK